MCQLAFGGVRGATCLARPCWLLQKHALGPAASLPEAVTGPWWPLPLAQGLSFLCFECLFERCSHGTWFFQLCLSKEAPSIKALLPWGGLRPGPLGGCLNPRPRLTTPLCCSRRWPTDASRASPSHPVWTRSALCLQHRILCPCPSCPSSFTVFVWACMCTSNATAATAVHVAVTRGAVLFMV